ncbi:MAG: type II toxin-antitoxin system ParD family antitoxin [Proteobacteria bacterium]|nr:type II toxin-antitoxin system ParD family antitoxin [Pseudomonadota bacterium]
MNITLGAEFENRIAKKVKSGLYTSASEVIRESLRMMFDQDLIREKKISVLSQQVLQGFSQLESGSYTDENIMALFEQSLSRVQQKQNSLI